MSGHCERCNHRGWLYDFRGMHVCRACWDWMAAIAAQRQGQTKVTEKRVRV